MTARSLPQRAVVRLLTSCTAFENLYTSRPAARTVGMTPASVVYTEKRLQRNRYFCVMNTQEINIELCNRSPYRITLRHSQLFSAQLDD